MVIALRSRPCSAKPFMARFSAACRNFTAHSFELHKMGGLSRSALSKTFHQCQSMERFAAAARAVPSPCMDCAFRATCAGRRRLLDQPDPYCPVVRGDDRQLKVRMAKIRELPKLEGACTTVVIGR